MMVLAVIYASFAYKMDDTATSLAVLTLSTFAGENVSKFQMKLSVLYKL